MFRFFSAHRKVITLFLFFSGAAVWNLVGETSLAFHDLATYGDFQDKCHTAHTLLLAKPVSRHEVFS